MTDGSHKNDDSSDAGLPETLRRELLRAYGDPPRVPPSLDDAILGAARREFGRRRRLRLVARWISVGAAAAAAIALMLWLPGTPSHRKAGSGTMVQAPVPTGQVTILDAFSLARAIEAGTAVRPEWDANRDGVVDRRDVDTLAAAAVRLDRGAS